MVGGCPSVPGAAYTQLVGARVGKKEPNPLNIEGSVLWLPTGASDLRGAKRQAAIIEPPLIVATPFLSG